MPSNDPAYMREWREKNRAHRRAYQRDWERKNPEKVSGYALMRKYGITPEQYDAMLAAQGNRCALCPAHVSETKMCVDHDHSTGRIRGLLCRSCNSALGKLGDSVESLERTLEYLKASPLALPLPDPCDSLLVQDLEVVAEAVEPGKDVI